MANQLNKFRRPADGGAGGAFSPAPMAEAAQHGVGGLPNMNGLIGAGPHMPPGMDNRPDGMPLPPGIARRMGQPFMPPGWGGTPGNATAHMYGRSFGSEGVMPGAGGAAPAPLAPAAPVPGAPVPGAPVPGDQSSLIANLMQRLDPAQAMDIMKRLKLTPGAA